MKAAGPPEIMTKKAALLCKRNEVNAKKSATIKKKCKTSKTNKEKRATAKSTRTFFSMWIGTTFLNKVVGFFHYRDYLFLRSTAPV
jgi:hypothetical protein